MKPRAIHASRLQGAFILAKTKDDATVAVVYAKPKAEKPKSDKPKSKKPQSAKSLKAGAKKTAAKKSK